MNNRLYWFLKNGSAFLLQVVVLPVFVVMFTAELLWVGFMATITADGCIELSYPWELKWPFFREDD